MQGQWQGQWGGDWLGGGEGGNPVVIAALVVGGFGSSQFTAQLLATDQPTNGPSGGANWTRGYKPTHDYTSRKRKSRRDELLFLRG